MQDRAVQRQALGSSVFPKRVSISRQTQRYPSTSPARGNTVERDVPVGMVLRLESQQPAERCGDGRPIAAVGEGLGPRDPEDHVIGPEPGDPLEDGRVAHQLLVPVARDRGIPVEIRLRRRDEREGLVEFGGRLVGPAQGGEESGVLATEVRVVMMSQTQWKVALATPAEIEVNRPWLDPQATGLGTARPGPP